MENSKKGAVVILEIVILFTERVEVSYLICESTSYSVDKLIRPCQDDGPYIISTIPDERHSIISKKAINLHQLYVSMTLQIVDGETENVIINIIILYATEYLTPTYVYKIEELSSTLLSADHRSKRTHE